MSQGVPPGTDPVLELSSYGGELVRMAMSLGLLVALLVAALWLVPRLARRRQQRSGTGRLRVVDSVRLDARTALHVVEFDARTLLLGAADGRVTRLDTGEPYGEPEPTPASFKEAMRCTP